MDPLTALGLASNIIQFADFALKIITSSAEIASEAAGATAHNLLSDEPTPEAPMQPDYAHGKAIRPHIVAVQQIAADCNVVCVELLYAVQGLRVKKTASNRRLRSLGIALKSVMKAKKIAALEEQLRRFQELLALHFFPLLNERQTHMSGVLWRLENQNYSSASEQSTRLTKLSSQLDELQQQVRALSSKKDSSAPQAKSKNATIFCPTTEDIQALGKVLDGLSLAEKDLTIAAKVQYLLRSLNFSTRAYRHEAIPEAHQTTFEWVFSNQMYARIPDAGSDATTKTTETPSNLLAWLKSGRGTFWVSGKAGSGKSTLMKFIAGHDKTRRALQRGNSASGAQKLKMIIASHYFWSAGTSMQKSLKGLLQELVYDVLRHCPELAPQIFPDRWQRIVTSESWTDVTMNSSQLGDDNMWTIKELEQGLLQIANHPALPVRCCFFIDGLDEYSGDHIELCQILKNLAISDNVKCCVSSRPWNVFEDAFGSSSGEDAAFLRVHELTYDDISCFARSRLRNNVRWREMGISDTQAEELACYITEHAKGVFLWVFLVTKSLREGVIDGDTFNDLKRRLNAVPTELEPYFKHMLDRVDATNHCYMA
ncbi:hypothetical protein SBRCBS47491_002941 [Sporothrix bragantina]|uniref:Nephrocystin 3-like N-terminal domain-containing protein n=1 Tax=Sporothrix bragantina TaxID=671064 RepID=A0ABP0BAY8_9PEZI